MSYSEASVRERPGLAELRLSALPTSPRHVRLLDRIAMRVGLWLLVRGAERARARTDYATHTHRSRLARERETREITTIQQRLLWPL